MLVIPDDVIKKLKDGYFLIVKEEKNITAWRFKNNELQNKVKHQSGETDWMTIKYLILPTDAKYFLKKKEET